MSKVMGHILRASVAPPLTFYFEKKKRSTPQGAAYHSAVSVSHERERERCQLYQTMNDPIK